MARSTNSRRDNPKQTIMPDNVGIYDTLLATAAIQAFVGEKHWWTLQQMSFLRPTGHKKMLCLLHWGLSNTEAPFSRGLTRTSVGHGDVSAGVVMFSGYAVEEQVYSYHE